MKTFRTVLFWMHLVAGLVAGISIGIMCFTGTVLAFEHEIVEWAERDARRVTVPADGTPRLSLADLQQRLRAAQPELRNPAVTLRNDPAAAVAFSVGRDDPFFADPYTGEIRQPASTKMHDFMHVMVDWHRYLALSGDNRPHGKLINGICNLAFCFLAVSGLYLWWPRTLTWRGIRAVALFNRQLTGKARDFNWHNVIGLWSAPVLIVLTLTAVPISFRWGGDLIVKLAGEEPAATPTPAAPVVVIERPSPDARPLAYDAVVTRVQQEFPRWQQINIRSGPLQRSRPPAPAGSGTPPARETSTANRQRPAGENSRDATGEGRAAPQPLTVTIREAGSWPRTATTTLTLNPFTGETINKTGYADLPKSRQIRSWTRFLHTGQALGWWGQLIAGLACLGGCFLVYTGFALSWRRFFGKNGKKQPASSPA